MSELFVSSSPELVAALKASQGGDVIRLAPGSYTPLTISNISTGGVTITSADSANPAVLTMLNVLKSSGITFQDVVFSTETATTGKLFQITQSSDISLNDISVHGSLDNDPTNDASGVYITRSSNVSVTNSEFQQLLWGISHADNEGLTFSGNSFHDIRLDGIRGGGSSNVLVTRNYFTDFYRQIDDHPDAIQFWTSNTTGRAHDITVNENVVIRGAGGTLQGVFITDQEGLGYDRVTVADNLIVGAAFNGIMVTKTRGLEVRDNTVVGYADQVSWIRLEQNEDILLAGNSLNSRLVDKGNLRLTQQDNVTLATEEVGGGAGLRGWVQDHAANAHMFPSAVVNLVQAFAAADLLQTPLGPDPQDPGLIVWVDDGSQFGADPFNMGMGMFDNWMMFGF